MLHAQATNHSSVADTWKKKTECRALWSGLEDGLYPWGSVIQWNTTVGHSGPLHAVPAPDKSLPHCCSASPSFCKYILSPCHPTLLISLSHLAVSCKNITANFCSLPDVHSLLMFSSSISDNINTCTNFFSKVLMVG